MYVPLKLLPIGINSSADARVVFIRDTLNASKVNEKGLPMHDFAVPGYQLKPLATSVKIWAGTNDANVALMSTNDQKKLNGATFFKTNNGFVLLKRHIYRVASNLFKVNFDGPPYSIMSPRKLKSFAANIINDNASESKPEEQVSLVFPAA